MTTNQAPSRPTRRIGRKLLLAACVFVLTDQATNYLVLGTGADGGWLAGRRIAPFDPPVFLPAQAATLDRLEDDAPDAGPRFGDVEFDAELGWAPPSAETSPEFNWCGARTAAGVEVAPARTDGVRRVAAFGCSFTYGSEVAGADAWAARLDAARPDLEVLNFGVPGYGLDQALLRYDRIAARDDAAACLGDEVWLGFLPGTLLRLVSVYRPALRHYTATVAVKPRFRLDASGALEHLPNPAGSVSDLVALLRDPERRAQLTSTDGFMLAAPAAYAPRGSHVLHWFATTRLLLTALERSGRDWATRAADPDDECHRLAVRVIQEFHDRVTASGRRFRLVLLPDRESLGPTTKPWDTLLATLRAASIDVVDVTAGLERADAAAQESMWARHGHYAEAANRIVAESLAEAVD